MVVIRLSRVGKTKQPSYRIVVQEKSKDPWGGTLEFLGTMNPRTNPATVVLNEERIRFWLAKGAQPSDTMWNLLVDRKIVTGAKRKTIRISEARRAKHAERARAVTPAPAPAEAPAEAPAAV